MNEVRLLTLNSVPLPSSVLMTAVTARAAGVRQVWVASPRPALATLAAAPTLAAASGFLFSQATYLSAKLEIPGILLPNSPAF